MILSKKKKQENHISTIENIMKTKTNTLMELQTYNFA